MGRENPISFDFQQNVKKHCRGSWCVHSKMRKHGKLQHRLYIVPYTIDFTGNNWKVIKKTDWKKKLCEKCLQKLGCCKYFLSISGAHGKIMFQPFVFPVKTKSQVTTFSTLQWQNSSNYAESNQISAESTPISYLDVESFQIDQEPLKKIWKTTNQFHSCLVDDLPNNANVWCSTYTN